MKHQNKDIARMHIGTLKLGDKTLFEKSQTCKLQQSRLVDMNQSLLGE